MNHSYYYWSLVADILFHSTVFEIRGNSKLMATLLKTVCKLSGHSSGPVLRVHKVWMEEMSYIRTMSAMEEFPLSKYFSSSHTDHFCSQTSFIRELACRTQSIFHVLETETS